MNFWELQTDLVLKLKAIGFDYKQKDRLPIFKLWDKLTKMGKKDPTLWPEIFYIKEQLEQLLYYKQEGLEPELYNKTRYK